MPPPPPQKFSCNNDVKADLFGNSTPQSTKYTPPKFTPKKKTETLKTRKRQTPPTNVSSLRKATKLDYDEPNLAKKDDPLVKRCPYCHEILFRPSTSNPQSPAPTLPQNLQDALDEIEAANTAYSKERKLNHTLPNKRFVANMDQFRFCQLHQLELKVKPAGIKSGYPIDIDFTRLGSRVESLLPALKQVINGNVDSSYHDIAVAAYKSMGVNKARSTMGVMSRFEKTLPGYYGPKGASIIMKTLNELLLLTGFLTKEKTSPQLPLEYMQQVLVPETGWRLIQEDLLNKKSTAIKRGSTDTSQKRAMELMSESIDFGTKMYPSNDDGDDTHWQVHNDEDRYRDAYGNHDDDSNGHLDDDQYTNDPAEILEYVSSEGEDNDG